MYANLNWQQRRSKLKLHSGKKKLRRQQQQKQQQQRLLRSKEEESEDKSAAAAEGQGEEESENKSGEEGEKTEDASDKKTEPVEKVENESEVAKPDVPLKYTSKKIFQFVHEILGAMASSGYPGLSLKLFLQGAVAADQCGFNLIAYEFVSQASILYEDELSDSKAQVRALISMVGTLLSCRNFSEEDYDTLITKTTQYGAKLLKKPDQCRMVTMCSHLFWVGKAEDEKHYHDARRVLECLQRSLKIADVCMSSSMHVQLFVEILNQYLYYFENNNSVITVKYINGLIKSDQ